MTTVTSEWLIQWLLGQDYERPMIPLYFMDSTEVVAYV